MLTSKATVIKVKLEKKMMEIKLTVKTLSLSTSPNNKLIYYCRPICCQFKKGCHQS